MGQQSALSGLSIFELLKGRETSKFMKDTPTLRIVLGIAMMLFVGLGGALGFLDQDTSAGSIIAAALDIGGLILIIMGIVMAVKNRKKKA